MIISSDINSIGELLDESWKYKREIPNVSNQFIDDVYSTAIKNGAIGGKLLGAGKGGFMFFMGLFIYVVFNELTKAPLIAKGDPFYGESERFHY